MKKAVNHVRVANVEAHRSTESCCRGDVKRTTNSTCFARESGVSATSITVSHVPPSKISVTETNSAESSIASKNDVISDKQSFGGSVSPLCYPRLDNTLYTGESLRVERISSVISLVETQEKSTMAKRSFAKEMNGCNISLSNDEEEGHATKKPRVEASMKNNLHPIAPRPFKMTTLLGQPTDAAVLSPLHVFVRQQIEVFTATEADITQPAPGRKNRIQLRQVGLRCIHCRDMPPRDRARRAICYPSGAGRVYHSVSDMKFAHFGHCKGLPADIRVKFQGIKEENKQDKATSDVPNYSLSSTAQYYHDSARQLGMIDALGGIFMANDLLFNCVGQRSQSGDLTQAKVLTTVERTIDTSNKRQLNGISPSLISCNIGAQACFQSNTMMSSLTSYLTSLNTPALQNGALFQTSREAMEANVAANSSSCLLASSLDQQHLNALHCFVRRHIELFVADKNDIAAPAPGRKTRVVLGQVGLRCIHCAIFPPKYRIKRAVCYPATVAGIYHSVSNMKFDHFDKCRGLPVEERAVFAKLRDQGPRIRKDKVPNSYSTAQYYHDSAARLGLVNSESGIRFEHSLIPTLDATATPGSQIDVVKASTLHDWATDGISALAIAAGIRAAAVSREFDV